MRRRRIRKLGRLAQRGSASMVAVCVTVVLFAAVAAGLIRVATLATVLERQELYKDRARDNAESVAIKAEKLLAAQLGPVIRAGLGDAEGSVNMHVPVLVGASFDPIHWDFDLNVAEYGPDERGEVDVIIRPSGPPIQKALSGVTGERRGVMLDEYDFTVEIRATGHSSMNASAQAIEFASQKVWVLSGPADSALIAKVKTYAASASKTSSSGDGSGDGAGSGLAAKGDPGGGLHAIQGGTLKISSLSGAHVQPSVPNVPDDTWTGDPEVVTGPIRYGLDKGDAVYAYELRGVPPGTHGANPNTTVLCSDDWRTSMTTYNRGSDTADFYDSNVLAHRKGTPWYAVVTVRPPSAGQGQDLPGGSGVLVLPNGRSFTLPALPDEWKSETKRITGPDSNFYLVTAQPYEPVNSNTSGGDAFFVGASSPSGSRPIATGSVVESSTTTIKVGGYAQDLQNSSAFGALAHQYSGTGPVQIGLQTVMSRRSSLSVGITGGTSSTPMLNSKSYIFEPDDPIDPSGPPPPPGGGCSSCDPPDPTFALVGLMFVPGDIAPLLDDRNLTPLPK